MFSFKSLPGSEWKEQIFSNLFYGGIYSNKS